MIATPSLAKVLEDVGHFLDVIENHHVRDKLIVFDYFSLLMADVFSDDGVLGILPPNTAKASEAPMFTGL